MKGPPNYQGGHTPADMGNALGACLADAKYLQQMIPKAGRTAKAAVTLIEKLSWCINLERERASRSKVS